MGILGVSYDQEVLRLIDKFNELGIFVSSVVITNMLDKLQQMPFKQLDKGIASVSTLSDQGLSDRYGPHHLSLGMGKMTTSKLVAIWSLAGSSGPGSGKLATCMSNMYPANQLKWDQIGTCQFETFPVWNLRAPPSRLKA